MAIAAKDLYADPKFHNDYSGLTYNFRTWLYDVAVFVFDVVFTIFFREINVRGTYHLPKKGTPTILVCAPHANQFIDPCLVMSQTRKVPGSRSRQTCFVTAEGPMKKNKYVKLFGSWTGAIPVARAQDNLKPVDPAIRLWVPDYENDPTLVKLVSVEPERVPVEASRRFTAKSLLGLQNYLSNAQIEAVIDDETIRLRKPFADKESVRKCISEPRPFMYAEKINNSTVFENVFNHLHTKGCVGIFPEGGSHDRPSLLPIKAGVAIMALGAVAADPTMEVHVVPCGLHYFHRHKFRSRATLEYGEPIVVTKEMGAEYSKDPRGAVSTLLKTVEQALYSVTVNAEDYETLVAVQTARRLYDPSKWLDPKIARYSSNGGSGHERIPLSVVVEMNRRLLLGYSKYKDEPRIQQLKRDIQKYNSMLFSMGLKDHQVAKLQPGDKKWTVLMTLLFRAIQVYFMVLLALPGTILFSPIFLTCKYFSRKKALEGLRKSAVKIKGQDLLATWKIVVALTMAPTLYLVYSLIMVYLTRKYPSIYDWLTVPHFVFNSKVLYFCHCYFVLMLTTYISFKTGEKGMDIVKSLPPLLVSLFYPQRTCKKIKETRTKLSQDVTSICNDLGPTVFPDLMPKSAPSENKEQEGERETKLEMEPRQDAEAKHKEEKEDEDNDNDNDNDSDNDNDNDNDNISSFRSRALSIGSVDSRASNALSQVNSRGSLTDVPIFSEGSHANLITEVEFSENPISVEPRSIHSTISSLIMKRRWKNKEE